jgi:hypothetical protein
MNFRQTTPEIHVWPQRGGTAVSVLPEGDFQRDFPACKILLVTDTLVGAEKHFVPGFFRLSNQGAVSKLMPANPPRKCDFMTGQTSGNRPWGPVVE